MNIPLSPKVSKIIYILLTPLNCGIIYLIFKAAFNPKVDGYEVFFITVGLMFSAAQFLLFMEFLSESMQAGKPYQWGQFFLYLLIMAGFSLITLWLGLGRGGEAYEFKLQGVAIPLPEPVGEIVGRVAFGLAGVLIARSTILYAVQRLRELHKLQK